MNDILTTKTNSPIDKVKRLVSLMALAKEIKPEIDRLKAELLKVTQDLDVLKLKTGDYTVTRAKRVTPEVVNFNELKQSLIDADIPYMTEEVFTDGMYVVFRKAIEENKELHGLSARITEYISIRIAEKEEK